MDFATVGWDDCKELCKWGSGGKEEATARQQAPGNGCCTVHGEISERWHPRVAKYNLQDCYLSSAEQQQWPGVQHSTPSFIHRCEEFGKAAWFHRELLWSERTILTDCDILMPLDVGSVEGRVYGIIRTQVNDECPSIWSDFLQQFPFKCLQVETRTQWEIILVEIKYSCNEGYCPACMETSQGNPR